MPRFKSTDPSGVPVPLSDGRVLASGEIAAITKPGPDDLQHIETGRLTALTEQPPAKRGGKSEENA